MWENFPAAEKFRQETIDFVRSGLGLAASDDDDCSPYDITSDKRIYGIREILKEIRGTYSVCESLKYLTSREQQFIGGRG